MRLIDADELDKKCFTAFHMNGHMLGESVLLKDIDNAPTVDPVVHRCWVGHECWWSGNNRNWNYCPTCGARMDGEK